MRYVIITSETTNYTRSYVVVADDANEARSKFESGGPFADVLTIDSVPTDLEILSIERE